MRIRKIKSIICNEEGSAIGLLVLILLSMTLLATTSITLAQTQYSWARFSRQTSNSYHLARSGAEKTVDSMNKEIAKVLPDMMKKASEDAHIKLLDSSGDGVRYKEREGAEAGPYNGQYVGASFENEYERQLKKLMYQHIATEFAQTVAPGPNAAQNVDYEAVKSDIKDPLTIKVVTNVYKNGSPGVPPELTGIVSGLLTSSEMDSLTDAELRAKDAFAVEVIAWAGENSKSSLTKSRIVGTIGIDQLNKDEELIEEYEWAQVHPEIFQSAVLSFGDFIINGSYKNTQINGDISVKGTKAETDALNQKFPEPDEFGGIVISDGAALTVGGNALVINNIQTTNTKGDGTKNLETTLHIKKDAIAQTIAINDNAGESSEPWGNLVSNNKITIDRNVYMENDLRIGRYVKGGQIVVGESVFGVSDGDKNGKIDPVTGIKYVDPNKSSGIYAMGKLADDPSTIEMARAFIAGQTYIDFGDGKGFHKLYESAGEPFEDVYYLDEYRLGYGEELDTGDGSPKVIGGDTAAYTTDFQELMNIDKIKIRQNRAYGPALISTRVPTSAPENFKAKAKEIFYAGLDGNLPVAEGELTGSSDWDNHILGITTNSANPKWRDIILDPLDFYNGDNPFKKDYLKGLNYTDLVAYKGLHGYMLAKRGIFYEHFEPGGGTAGLTPKERKFKDLIDVDVFTDQHEWSQNNPIKIITARGETSVNISDYKNIPTAIICTKENSVLKLTSRSSQTDFTGIIVTPGKIIVDDKMTINGLVIAGNEYDPDGPMAMEPTTQTIRTGVHAGIQIKTNSHVKFNYDVSKEEDRNMIFDIRFMDKSLQRKLYDCLGMTNYGLGGISGDMDIIFGPSTKRKVKLSNESVISSNQEGLQFTMKSLKKIEK